MDYTSSLVSAANQGARIAFGRDATPEEINWISSNHISNPSQAWEFLVARTQNPSFVPARGDDTSGIRNTWDSALKNAIDKGWIKPQQSSATTNTAPATTTQQITQTQPVATTPVQSFSLPGGDFVNNPSFFGNTPTTVAPTQTAISTAVPAQYTAGLTTAYNAGYQPTISNGTVAQYNPGVSVTPTPMTLPEYNLPLSSANLPEVKLESGFPGVAPLVFNYAQEEQKSYESLKPFYDKLLSFAGGRLDLAKRLLEYTYQQGMRESAQEYNQGMRELAITLPQEREEMLTTQNQRGIMDSGFGKTSRGRLAESQNLRQEAVQRALENRENKLAAQRGFGLEEKTSGFLEEGFNLEREKRKEASDIAAKKYGIQSDIFQSQVQAKTLEENRKAAAESLALQKESLNLSKQAAGL